MPDRAYMEWVTITIKNASADAPIIVVKNVKSNAGKFYRNGNKDDEVTIGEIEDTRIGPNGGTYRIDSCGLRLVPKGCEGSFELWTESDTPELVKVVKFDCPLWSGKNSFSCTDGSDKWAVVQTGGNLNDGALGDIVVKLVYMKD